MILSFMRFLSELHLLSMPIISPVLISAGIKVNRLVAHPFGINQNFNSQLGFTLFLNVPLFNH